MFGSRSPRAGSRAQRGSPGAPEDAAAIFEAPSSEAVAAELRRRISAELTGRSDETVQGLLADAVYQERRRFQQTRGELGPEDRAEAAAIEEAARASHGGRADWERAIYSLVERYGHEIHNRFSQRTYRFATRVLPAALTRLLTAVEPRELVEADFDPASRIKVHGPTEAIARLAQTHTLILAPTHVSNLDSPLLGYALYAAGLPPFLYGAGLNLFENPVMAAFMSRLGAYTVDRRKKHSLYKDVLKAYSVDALGRRNHSLFFPGGTRSRSGLVEKKLKKGLLGTGISAWQEGVELGRPNPEILVVPCTLSMALVLEAETLIEDALAEEGRARYIITDDEFSQPRTVAHFARRVLNLDAAVHVRFGQPMDLLGNPVDDEGRSLDRSGLVIDRRAYVTDSRGNVVRDEQRDHVYTEILAQNLIKAWHRDNTVQSTHVAAFAAWNLLRALHPRMDTWRLCLTSPDERRLDRRRLLEAIDRLLRVIRARVAAGTLHEALGEGGAEAQLDRAITTFSTFHTRPALEPRGAEVLVDPRLALYYGNRLVGYALEGVVTESADRKGAV